MDKKIKEMEQRAKSLIAQHKTNLKLFGNHVFYDGFGAPKELTEILESEGVSALKYMGLEDLYKERCKWLESQSSVKNLPEFKFKRKRRK
jgi:transketolase C-terminal domain/subunit